MNQQPTPIRRALLSVSDKTGIVALARALIASGVEVVSTGGTAKLLSDHDLAVKSVTDITEFPEIMDNRVKTLHPRIHGGILGRRDIDAEVMQSHGIPDIDLVVVNLYPFESVAKTHDDAETLIKNIDIGGPAMIRAAAKNNEWVTCVVDPNDYPAIVKELTNDGALGYGLRQQFAVKAFQHTAYYDSLISQKLAAVCEQSMWPGQLTLPLKQVSGLRYGENPHQAAYRYQYPLASDDTLATVAPLQGKEISFNNLNDAQTAMVCAYQFDTPACVIVKHSNPCGCALADDLLSAYEQAFASDPDSAFGGIIAFNQPVDGALMDSIYAKQFVEVILAPSFTEAAIEVAKQKPNCRLLAIEKQSTQLSASLDIKPIEGGCLLQSADDGEITAEDLTIAGEKQPDSTMIADALFAWKVCKHVKSNAIVYAADGRTIGIGAGQTRRVLSAEIGVKQAEQFGLPIEGSVMASDAFLPFADNVEVAAKAGIRCIIQPGGSKRDPEVIAAADKLGIVMLFTGMRHFKH